MRFILPTPKWLIAPLIITLASLGASSTAAAAPRVKASATPYKVSGRLGKVVLYRTDAVAGAGWNGVNGLGLNGPDVYRVRGFPTIDQGICVRLGLFKFIPTTPLHDPNSWRLWDQRHHCVRARPGRFWRSYKNPAIGGWQYIPAQEYVGWGTVVRVSWYALPSERMLGTVTYKYQPADYNCIDVDPGDIRHCEVGPGTKGLGAVTFTTVGGLPSLG